MSPESLHVVFERSWLHLRCPNVKTFVLVTEMLGAHGHPWPLVALGTEASIVGSGYAVTAASPRLADSGGGEVRVFISSGL